MNNQNQNPQDEITNDPSARNEHGFFTKARAMFAGAVLVGGTAAGVGIANANNAPDSEQGRVDTPATAPETPGPSEVVVDDTNMTPEPGTVLTAKPKPIEAPKAPEAAPTHEVAQTPAPVQHEEPKHPAADKPSPEGPVVVDDNNMKPTPAPEGPVIIDDNNMTPTPSPTPEGPVVVDDSGMMPRGQ